MNHAMIWVLLTAAALLVDLALRRQPWFSTLVTKPSNKATPGNKKFIFGAILLGVLIVMALVIRSFNDLFHALFIGLWVFVVILISRFLNDRVGLRPRLSK